MKDITVWECWTKQKDGSHVWEHNHVQDGHAEGDFPKPVVDVPGQQGWKNFKWRKFHGYLDEKGVVQLTAPVLVSGPTYPDECFAGRNLADRW